ncbi:hypothetical protein R5R35_007613 [Gryllus longicercus]|uniref:TIR domain-containing protein n=1 Tax=Gryllus longicercus TaxID=2509291 RepID=A0AAN9VMZ9_9ORTH
MGNVWPEQHTPYNMDSAFLPLNQTATWANETETPEREVTFCIEISGLTKYYIPQPYDASISLDMGFSTGLHLAAGVVSMTENCWYMKKYCNVEIKLRADILDLPFAKEAPNHKEFWNFTSPLLRPELRWLKELRVANIQITEIAPLPSNTSGSSLQLLSLRGVPGLYHYNFTLNLTNMPWLRHLDIFQANIRRVSSETFTGCPLIEYLDLSRNSLSEIPPVVKRLKYLESLQLQSNYIDFNLTSENLLPLKKLRTLSFGGTPIAAWTTPIPPLPLLINLTLSDCSLTKPGPSPLEFPALEILDLSQNYNISLSQNTFTKLRKLKQLILRGCALSIWPTLPANHFTTIDLSGNNFTTLVNLEEQGVTVEVLNMSQNKIFEWDDPDVFLIHGNNEKFSNLESQFTSLRLEKNHFATPDVKSQKQAPNLHGKTHSSRRATWVQQVNLSLNSISAFTPAMLESLSSLAAVDLGGNHIDCSDCRTPALQSWLRAAGSVVKVLVLGEEGPLRCFLPASLEGAPVAAVQFDASACRDPTVRLRWALGLPLSVALSALLLFGALGFCYRTEVAYLVHLARVRASARRPADLGRCAYDAFVCYSGKNRKWVMRRLMPLLERRPQSYVLCLFDRDFRLGTHIVTNIVDAIEHSRKVIVVLTQHFIDSKWCQWELEMAQHKLFSEDREFLVLLELEPLERRRLPRLLRFLLDTRPVVRWPRPESAPAVMAAAAELRAVLGPSLRQTLLADPPTGDEHRPTTSSADMRTPLLDNSDT